MSETKKVRYAMPLEELDSREMDEATAARREAKLTSGKSVEDMKALAYLGVNPLQQMAAAVVGNLVTHFWIVRPLLTGDIGITELYEDILTALHGTLNLIDVDELSQMQDQIRHVPPQQQREGEK